MPNRKIFDSLRVRYAGTAILFALVILIGATLAYFSVTGARQTTASSIEDRKLLLQRTRHIRNAIRKSYESLELFLFNPNKNVYQKKIHASINQAILHIEGLLKDPIALPQQQKQDIPQLKKLLVQYDRTVQRLIDIRTNATQQYPSLALTREQMLVLNSEFVTATSLAITESREELLSDKTSVDIYTAFIQARHHWTQMASNFRMYLANRLGTFDNTVFPSQIVDIELQREALLSQLELLHNFNEQQLLGFQGATSLLTMQANTDAWYRVFLQVIKIHESDEWRTDAKLIREEVEPLLERISDILSTLDIAAESWAEEDVKLLGHIAQSQTNTLWFMTALAILFVLSSYILLEKSILRPVFNLTNALRAEAHGTGSTTLAEVTTIETQHLMDAFTEMRKQIHSRQNALEYQALHDSLTGLANRNLLLDRLQQAIQQTKRHKNTVSLLIMDLDGFKEVNDTLGHQIGDHLLEEMGHRLTDLLREIDTVARLGGDEFAILLPENNQQQAVEVAQKILKSLETEFSVQDIKLFIGASIGIACCPDHSNDVQDLIKFADVAMYVAKRNKLGYAIYDAQSDTHSIGQLALGSELRNALGTPALHLVYQPKLDMKTGQLTSVEALFRWTHPTLGPVSAAEAIGLAERTGFINQLTIWIIDEAIKQYGRWRDHGLKVPIAINLSAFSLQSDHIIQQIIERLDQSDYEQNFLMFELTESAMMVDPKHSVQALRTINSMGAKISIDDFGTGFSSLSYLKQMPVDELKVDKSFVIDMAEDENDAIIVRSIIDLAHNLGLKVVAEGVENQQTWQQLEALHCDIVQGYHICPPKRAEDLLHWYESGEDKLQRHEHA
ncbi:MAG: EAL domain-containing protein [Gammaproteobacteria bacterium]|nr:EAL domain-containing protein [Gammaproteobacteria bacterium]